MLNKTLTWFLSNLMTSLKSKIGRIRVDVAQTGFFDGREFRTFREFDADDGTELAAGATLVLMIDVPVNTIIFSLNVILDSGFARVRTYLGGVEVNPFNVDLPIIPRNTMTDTPAYTPQLTIKEGGTFSGGTRIDALRVRVQNSTGQASSVGGSSQDERGIPPGKYFIEIKNLGTSPMTGVISSRWEERPTQ